MMLFLWIIIVDFLDKKLSVSWVCLLSQRATVEPGLHRAHLSCENYT